MLSLFLALSLQLTGAVAPSSADPGARSGGPAAPAYDGAQAFTKALARVRDVALRSEIVDWGAVEAELRPRAVRARDEIDLLPVYRDLLRALGDRHSFVQVDAEMLETYRARSGEALYSAPATRPTSRFVGRTEVSAETLSLGDGAAARLVVVPGMTGGGARANVAAERLFAAVAAPETVCGFIIDLRGNTGGNVWPMLLGLNPLLGDGLYGQERDRAGRDAPYARIARGSAIVLEGEYKDMTMVSAGNWRSVDLTSRPVGVLIDDATASSGEGVAVAFEGRPETRFFGQKTYGVASSNLGVSVSDAVNLVVTTALMVDRNGRTYSDGVTPDETVEGDARPAALAWLARRPGCAA